MKGPFPANMDAGSVNIEMAGPGYEKHPNIGRRTVTTQLTIMSRIKSIFTLAILAALFFLASCNGSSGASDTQNYFATTQIQTPRFSNDIINKHLAEFALYYNELAAAAEVKNKEAMPELSRLFSDWIVKAMSLRETLSTGEQGAFDTYMDRANQVWNEQKSLLL